jgi:prophage regulatory protein
MPTVMSLDRASLRLVGAHEIRLHFGGISRQRVYQLTTRTDFPAPVADLAQGKVWLADEVEEWRLGRQDAILKHGRRE